MRNNSNNKISVFIPTYNEEGYIGEVIDKLKKLQMNLDIYVIDDGSKDNSYKIAVNSGVKVIRHYINLGGGAAIKTAFKIALLNDVSYIVTIDADGQHDPMEIPKMIKIMKNENIGLLIGSRFLNNKELEMKKYRSFGIKFFSTLVSILTNTKITDATSCYRIYKTDYIKLIYDDLNETQYYAIEIILKMGKIKAKIKEVSIKDISRVKGESKKGVLLYLYNLLRVIIRNIIN